MLCHLALRYFSLRYVTLISPTFCCAFSIPSFLSLALPKIYMNQCKTCQNDFHFTLNRREKCASDKTMLLFAGPRRRRKRLLRENATKQVHLSRSCHDETSCDYHRAFHCQRTSVIAICYSRPRMFSLPVKFNGANALAWRHAASSVWLPSPCV